MKPNIIVVRQLGGVGDVLMLSCVFRGLREHYPTHKLTLVTANVYLGGALMDLAQHNPLIDEIMVIEPWEATTEDTKRVWGHNFGGAPPIEAELWWKMADITICLNTKCVDYEWVAMNTPEGIQKPRWQIWCEAAGVVPSSYAPIYQITPQEQSQAQAYISERWPGKRPLVGVGLSAHDKKRAWPQGKLQDLCHELFQAGVTPVTVDNTNQFDGVDAIVGKRIREIIPLLAEMDAVISVDSGILHMAGAVGTPVVGIFGPTDQVMRMANYQGVALDSRRFLGCAPCWYAYPCLQVVTGVHSCPPYECFNRIPVGMIVEGALRLLKTSKKGHPNLRGVL